MGAAETCAGDNSAASGPGDGVPGSTFPGLTLPQGLRFLILSVGVAATSPAPHSMLGTTLETSLETIL